MNSPFFQVYLGLGSNVGNREELLIQAVNLLHQIPEVFVIRSSAIYETEPVGYTEQAPFLNTVIEIKTSLSASELLVHTQRIEAELGRIRTFRWGPRTLDIDILLYENSWIHNGELQIPHPRMTERAFVLIPLAEIAPEAQIPYREGEGLRFLRVMDALAHVDGKEGVRKQKVFPWEYMNVDEKVENS
jgi:2-amino-4-hydroxy-6-hydroxymethyldihydropteridine diphosphokinase